MKFYPFDGPNHAYNQGQLLANYLAGTNSARQPVALARLSGPKRANDSRIFG